MDLDNVRASYYSLLTTRYSLHLSQRPGERAAVNQQILARDESRMRRAQKRASGAEFGHFAQALCRDRRNAFGFRLLVGDVAALGGAAKHGLEPVGFERAGEQIVDRDVLLGDLARDAGHENAQAAACAGGKIKP